MTTVLTRDVLRRFLGDRFAVDTASLGDEDRLFSGGLLDSFHLVELISFLESTAGVKIGVMDVQLDNLDSIESILRFVHGRVEVERAP